jgi:hypothetical protein
MSQPFVTEKDMHFKGVYVGKIISTHEDLISHSYPLLIQPKDTPVRAPVQTSAPSAPSSPKSKKKERDVPVVEEPVEESTDEKLDSSDSDSV